MNHTKRFTNLWVQSDESFSEWTHRYRPLTDSTSNCFNSKGDCDEWGGAESRGNGARPVEWMIMNDTCATHRSRVPRRSFGRNKRRSDDIGRRERTSPGFRPQCNAVDMYGKKEAGTGEHLNTFNQINKHKWKAAAPHGRLPRTQNTN